MKPMEAWRQKKCIRADNHDRVIGYVQDHLQCILLGFIDTISARGKRAR